jgi:uncharacterized protein with PIN domain
VIRVAIRFYEELNDFLPRARRKIDIDYSFAGRRSVKDLIESFGVPHVEVDLILVNGISADFEYIINDGDRISVYPVFETLSLEGVTRLRPSPLRETKFIADVHLAALARKLRFLGFDVDFSPDRDDPQLAEISEREKRVLLTRDRRLLMRRNVSRGIIIRNTDPAKQVIEVINRLDLWSAIKPFSRCIECNGTIRELPVSGGEFPELKSAIPEGVIAWCDEYYICGSCKKIYWKGSHYLKLKAFEEWVRSMKGADK